MGIHAEVNRNKTVKNIDEEVCCHPQETQTVYHRPPGPARIGEKEDREEKKVVIRYSIKNSLVLRIRSGVKYRGRVFYEPLNRERLSSHIVEFGTRVLRAHQSGSENNPQVPCSHEVHFVLL